MKSKSDVAVDKFSEGYNCAQSVLFAFCDELHFDKNLGLKIACGFGGGMGRNEQVCGAVSGGVAALGLKYGRGEKEDRSTTELTYAKTRELMDRFATRHGTFICRQLLQGCDLLTDEGRKHFQENDLFHRVCSKCVADAASIVEDIFREE
jgi:C_GCAxxG_C_C family probable redox protein